MCWSSARLVLASRSESRPEFHTHKLLHYHYSKVYKLSPNLKRQKYSKRRREMPHTCRLPSISAATLSTTSCTSCAVNWLKISDSKLMVGVSVSSVFSGFEVSYSSTQIQPSVFSNLNSYSISVWLPTKPYFFF